MMSDPTALQVDKALTVHSRVDRAFNHRFVLRMLRGAEWKDHASINFLGASYEMMSAGECEGDERSPMKCRRRNGYKYLYRSSSWLSF